MSKNTTDTAPGGKAFAPLAVSVITVSDTRTEETDRSGDLLCSYVKEAGHSLLGKKIIPDDVWQLRAAVSALIADPQVQVVLLTGGTGFTVRDNTFKALSPLLEVPIDGFGELFRQLSYQEIGTSTIQSRAFAGLSNGTIIFCVPGSPGACSTAWEGIIAEQLDNSHRPCNFADKLRPVGN